MKTTQKNKKLLTLYVKKLVKENYFNDDVLTDFLYHYNSQKLAELNTTEGIQNYLINVLLDNPDVKADKQKITIYNNYYTSNKTTARKVFDNSKSKNIGYDITSKSLIIYNH